MLEEKKTPIDADGVKNLVIWSFFAELAAMDKDEKKDKISWFLEAIEVDNYGDPVNNVERPRLVSP